MASKQISRTISVPADSTTTVYTNTLVSPICVSAVPSEGGSAKVYFTISQKSKVDADEANWFEWGKGTVTSADVDVLLGPATALRLQAIDEAAVFDILA